VTTEGRPAWGRGGLGPSRTYHYFTKRSRKEGDADCKRGERVLKRGKLVVGEEGLTSRQSAFWALAGREKKEEGSIGR